MSSDVDQLMAPWGNIAPGFWDTGNQSGAADHVQNVSAAPSVPPDGPTAPPAAAPGEPSAASAVTSTAPPAPADVQPDGKQVAPDAVPVPPPEYAARVSALFRTKREDTAGLAAAAEDAGRLDQEITARFGEVHSYAVSIREIRGWLALESKQAETAVRWYLHTTGLQCRLWGAGHPFTRNSAEQAVYAWSTIAAPEQARMLGSEVLTMLQQAVGEDDKLAAHVRRQLAKTQPASVDQRPGPGTGRPVAGGS